MGKTVFRFIMSVFILICCIGSLAGCSKKPSDDSLKKVLEAGELIVGFDENFPPMGFRNKSYEIVGFDIDFAREVCKRLGIELVLKPILWEEKENELNNGNIDCIWNGMCVNEERRESMNLSEPYLVNDLIFLVKRGSEIKNIEDLKGKKLGLQAGSSVENALAAAGMEKDFKIVRANDNIVLFKMIDAGALDVLLLDSLFAYYYIADTEKEYYILPSILETEDISIGFRKNDATLRDGIQEVINEMKKDGKLGEISVNWFGADVTKVK